MMLNIIIQRGIFTSTLKEKKMNASNKKSVLMMMAL